MAAAKWCGVRRRVFGNRVPEFPVDAKLCVLGYCLLCKIVTPSCFCCSQLRTGLRLFGFHFFPSVHFTPCCCLVCQCSFLIVCPFCYLFVFVFSRLFCRVLRTTTSCCTQYFCSCALQFMCHCRAAVHCLCLPPTLRTAVAAVHRVYCPRSSMPHFFNVPWYELP